MTEHVLEHLRALSNHPKCILRRPSEKIQLLRDPLHRQRVRKVQQLSRASNLAVLHNVQIPDGCHLHTHARHTLRSTPHKNIRLPVVVSPSLRAASTVAAVP